MDVETKQKHFSQKISNSGTVIYRSREKVYGKPRKKKTWKTFASGLLITIGSTLTAINIFLKLLGFISWSWGWVLSPIGIAALVFIGVYILILDSNIAELDKT